MFVSTIRGKRYSQVCEKWAGLCKNVDDPVLHLLSLVTLLSILSLTVPCWFFCLCTGE